MVGRCFLITGAGGKLGSSVLDRFVEEKSTNIGLGRSPAQHIENYVQWDLIKPHPDVETAEKLEQVTDLVHLAAIVEEPPPVGVEALRMVSVNILGSINLLRSLPLLEHITFISSVAVYGPPQVLPCDEAHPIRPTRLYGVTKHAMENLFRLHAKRNGLSMSALRIASVYGFRDEKAAGAIGTFISRCHNHLPLRIIKTGKLLRDYIHVADAVNAIWTSTMRRISGTFNIASGEGHSLLDIAYKAGEIVGWKPEIIWDFDTEPDFDFTTDVTYDIRKARRAWGYNPQVSILEGMRKSHEFLLNTGN